MSNIVKLEEWIQKNKCDNELSRFTDFEGGVNNKMDVMEIEENVEMIRGLIECFYTDKDIYDELINSMTDEEIKYWYKKATGKNMEV